ncbi:uncharacterized protein [Pempheris klunzingeri]|uniref:uncharacterized protein n=1 Tax=Pempheris klunzingeri TaxID=3127111 RepID=UPI00397F14B5
MTPLRFALCLTYLFLGGLAQITDLSSSIHVRQTGGFYSANVGDSVTLRCFDEARTVYWYKQTLGQKLRIISSLYKHDKSGTFHNEFKNNSRFTLDAGIGKYHLIISDLGTSDSATYYCAGGYGYDLEFSQSITVSVKGPGLNIPALVHQSASETIQPGGSETLNCTVHTGNCDGEHRVYWFRHSEESHPGLIYTHGGREDHTCVYNLPMESLNLSHAGTYYCAVASCGHVVFGKERKLDLEDEPHSFVLVYFLSGALSFTTILVVVLVYAVCTINNRNSCQCADSRSSAALNPNEMDHQDSDNLHYTALREPRVNRSARQRDDTQDDCVYSSVKQ